MQNFDYKNKYLKYKNKYIYLKKLHGGGDTSHKNMNICYENNYPVIYKYSNLLKKEVNNIIMSVNNITDEDKLIIEDFILFNNNENNNENNNLFNVIKDNYKINNIEDLVKNYNNTKNEIKIENELKNEIKTIEKNLQSTDIMDPNIIFIKKNLQDTDIFHPDIIFIAQNNDKYFWYIINMFNIKIPDNIPNKFYEIFIQNNIIIYFINNKFTNIININNSQNINIKNLFILYLSMNQIYKRTFKKCNSKNIIDLISNQINYIISNRINYITQYFYKEPIKITNEITNEINKIKKQINTIQDKDKDKDKDKIFIEILNNIESIKYIENKKKINDIKNILKVLDNLINNEYGDN